MSVTLPDDVAWVLNILGFMWPEADEDKLRACAQAWRDFGSELGRIKRDTHQVAAQVTAENKGDSIDAFERYWQGIGGSGGDFTRAAEAADHMAVALDGMAWLVEGVKLAIIVQLGILAAEIIADQVAAPETLGLSEGAAVGEIIVTRGIVRRIIQEGMRRIGSEIVQSLKGRVLELLRKILATALRRAVTGAVVAGASDVGKQELDINVFHTRRQLNVTEVAGATGTGAVLGAVVPVPTRDVVRGPSRYTLRIDNPRKTLRVESALVLNRSKGRNKKAQLQAGGKDRRATDEGGHYVGRRFDGALDAFNHFAQDKNFNRGAYKSLENTWMKALDRGKEVYLTIQPVYPRGSERPDRLLVTYTIDGETLRVDLLNRPGGK